MLWKEEMAALLPTEPRAPEGQHFSNVTIAHRGALQRDTSVAKLALHTRVRQDRRDHTLRAWKGTALSIQRNQADHHIAINQDPTFINNCATVSVSVERDPKIGTELHDPSSERRRRRCTHSVVDQPFTHRHSINRCARCGECRFGERGTRPVRCIKHHSDASGGAVRRCRRCNQRELRCIARRIGCASRVVARIFGTRGIRTRAIRARRGKPFINHAFQFTLERIRNLAAITTNHLQAVVFRWVVRSGHHHTAGNLCVCRHDRGEPWCWDYAKVDWSGPS